MQMNDKRLAGDLARRMDTIESTYEFMLGFAGQGWRAEEGGDRARRHLERASRALDGLAPAVERALSDRVGSAVARRFSAVIAGDSERADAAIALVLAHPAISSQLVDNLNTSTHLRAVLTDLFLIEEWVEPAEFAQAE